MKMTEVATVLDDPVSWTALLSDDVPADYVAAVRAEARATARHAQVAKIVAELEAKVSAGAADPAVDPATLIAPASELAAARALASVAPPIVPVPQSVHDAVAAMLPRPNIAVYRMVSPPQYLGALVHHQRSGHAQIGGELPPEPTPLDVRAVKEYEQVAAQAAAAWSSLSLFDTAPQGPMADYVRAWYDTLHSPAWPALREAIDDLTTLIDAADDARPPSGSCSFGSHASFRLQPAQPGDPAWTFAWAVKWGVMLVTPPMRNGVLLPVS
jgi:hypothetical protein